MRTRKTFSGRQRLAIILTGNTIRTRRKALGITQGQLEFQAGVTHSTVERLECRVVSHRAIPPTDPRCLAVFEALARLEKEAGSIKIKVSRAAPKRVLAVATRLFRRRPKIKPDQDASVTLSLCPDQRTEYGTQGLWITQAGCEAMAKTNWICRTRADGSPCPGVRYRRGLERKEIAVKYTPPKPPIESGNSLRFEDWQ